MSVLKNFIKDTFIYGLAAVLPRAVNVFLVKLHTATLGAEKYAINTDYYVYAAYLNALLTLGMETAFFRFFSKEREKNEVISTSFIALVCSSVGFLGIALYYHETIALFLGFQNPLFFKLLVWTIFLDTLVVIPYAYLRVNNQSKRFTFFKTVNILVFGLLNVFFLWYIPFAIQHQTYITEGLVDYYNSTPKVIHIFVSGTVASAVSFICLVPVLFKFSFSFNRALLRKMLVYSFPIMIGSLAFVTNENLDKLLLGKLIGEYEMGVYAACYKLGVFMTLYIMAFRLGAEPFFFNYAGQKNAKKAYATILTWFTILGALFMLCITVFIDFFAGILLGKPEYFSALYIVPIILLANLCLGIYNNLSMWYKLTDNTRYGMYFSLVGAGITVAVNLVLIPVFGVLASAWATLLAYGVMTVLSFVYGKKHYPVDYPIKRLSIYVFTATALSGVSFLYFRNNILVSILFILLFLLLIYTSERKNIQALLHKNA